ncbi:MAG TPA: cytochrome c biogenesis protein ResB [Nocardioidaceae bacterium]|jgi:cytochrome c biogenesis protein|nr:cytochrome c biogenesis protein ResB [Actinomycetota bacterium]HEV8056442.1 cytochrome c biogenesis protein ResB [Nocardioidaceae bacterium]
MLDRKSPRRAAPALPPAELARWAWRQLTSMRTALILLFMLAVAAIPGSVIPQRDVAPAEVFAVRQANPTLALWYERLGLFDVYSSVWFSAIYLLLMVSLIGCVVPRSRQYWNAWRAAPPKAPSRLSRLPASEQWSSAAPAGRIGDAAQDVLGRQRFRLRRYTDDDGRLVVAAQRGRLREGGNLVFHVSLLVVLVGVAYGSVYGFRGGALVVEGEGFSNTLTQYDEFTPGARFDPATLTPFSFTLDDFAVTFETDGQQRGAPRSFSADLSYVAEPGQDPQTYDLRVNHPLQVGATSVFLIDHGYAPLVTVRDGNGDVAFRGSVPFLNRDSSLTGQGVIKVPDAEPEQLGFGGFFLPTFSFDPELGPHSTFPDALRPALVLTAYRGDLGMDDGRAQSVYVLDKDRLTQFRDDGEPFRLLLQPGEVKQLPDGAGSISFDGLNRMVALQVSSTPGRRVALGGVLAAIAGLVATLYVRPRRVWVRADPRSGATVVELAGLDRETGGDLATDLHTWAAQIRMRTDFEEPK